MPGMLFVLAGIQAEPRKHIHGIPLYTNRETPLISPSVMSPTLPAFLTNTPLHPSFDEDIRDTHLIYEYNAENPETGAPEKWRYEMWFMTETRCVYAIHGGPMAGRLNYQTCTFQCIRPGELWQCNWLEETGTVVSLVYDVREQRISTLIAFSQGHWERAAEARGDKRDPRALERWRALATVGKQTDRFMLSEQADILQRFKGRGDLEPVEPDVETF
ncbi:Calycin-like protein [Xylariales sp. PMI_506]|nr:Calycin-like protein [Xylariales sp. PMI_506]